MNGLYLKGCNCLPKVLSYTLIGIIPSLTTNTTSSVSSFRWGPHIWVGIVYCLLLRVNSKMIRIDTIISENDTNLK